MKPISQLCLVLIAIVLAGCAAGPTVQGAPPVKPDQHYGLAKSEVLSNTDHMTQLLREDNPILYFQNQGGGGLGLGLLMGPIGVAANMKMIESVTLSDVESLKGKLDLDPASAFKKAAAGEHVAINDPVGSQDVRVSPFILISKTDESKVHISSALIFEGGEGKEAWRRKYQYQLPGSYTLEQLAALTPEQMAAVQNASADAYVAILRHIAKESDAQIAGEQAILFKSPYISPRFNLEMFGSLIGEKDDRVWVRAVFGVVAVDPADITYKARN